LLESNQIKTKKVEGMEEEFLTKAEINRAWNRKKKLDADDGLPAVVRAAPLACSVD
jgi:hypothetical protein